MHAVYATVLHTLWHLLVAGGCPYPGRRFTVGDKVMMKPGVTDSKGALSPGDVGTITNDDEGDLSGYTYKVRSAGGSTSGWFKESEVQCPTITTTPLTTTGITTEHTGRSTWINTVIAMCTLVLDPE